MTETVSAAEANRNFSSVLRGVREGTTYLITSHGRPVAKLVPIGEDEVAFEAARTRLIARLRAIPAANLGTFRREQAYEDEE